jgi:hypothetical protein
VVLSYDYRARTASLDDPPSGELSPHLYLLCADCADRLSPPRGWQIHDRRAVPRLFLHQREAEPAQDDQDVPDGLPEPAVNRHLFFGEGM